MAFSLIEALEGYYRKNRQDVYPEGQRVAIEAWLRGRDLSDRKKRGVYAHILKNYSTRWGRFPAIAELEEACLAVDAGAPAGQLYLPPPPDEDARDYSNEIIEMLKKLKAKQEAGDTERLTAREIEERRQDLDDCAQNELGERKI